MKWARVASSTLRGYGFERVERHKRILDMSRTATLQDGDEEVTAIVRENDVLLAGTYSHTRSVATSLQVTLLGAGYYCEDLPFGRMDLINYAIEVRFS